MGVSPPPATAAGPPDPPPPEGTSVHPALAALDAALPAAGIRFSFHVGDWTAILPPAHLPAAAARLRAAGFDLCADVTAVDWPDRPDRFDVIYVLASTGTPQRVRLKTRVGTGTPVPSVSGVWPAANWLEREVFDMFGVTFSGHPDLRRILMPDNWQGHPQRKDYPLEGPGELLLENPLDWLRLRQAADEADIE